MTTKMAYCLECKTSHKMTHYNGKWWCLYTDKAFTNQELTSAFLNISKESKKEMKKDDIPLYPPLNSQGTKHDQNKTMVELLPIESLEEIAKVLTFGAKKYDAENWRKGISYKRVLGAIMRHLFAYMRREDKDPESGLSHLAHAGCGILFLLWYEKYRPSFDDRYEDAK